MTLTKLGLWETTNVVDLAIRRLREFEPPEGYYLAFSGGKDSVTILRLAQMAGVQFDAHYSITSVDPPELVRFIKQEHPQVNRDYPGTTMWKAIVKNGIPPSRTIRYCCRDLKEGGGKGRVVVTGIRAAESRKRKSRRMFEACYRVRKQFLHPIIDWTHADVWKFIRQEQIPYCSLYDEGFKRLGCIMCPMKHGKRMMMDAERWPTYYRAYLRAFGQMLDARRDRRTKANKFNWQTAEDVMNWWLWEPRLNEGQMRMFDSRRHHGRLHS